METLDWKAVTPEQLAGILSQAYRRRISEELVREIAEKGDLLAEDGTLNVVQYAAYLAGEVQYA
jgi:hypothetical protein